MPSQNDYPSDENGRLSPGRNPGKEDKGLRDKQKTNKRHKKINSEEFIGRKKKDKTESLSNKRAKENKIDNSS